MQIGSCLTFGHEFRESDLVMPSLSSAPNTDRQRATNSGVSTTRCPGGVVERCEHYSHVSASRLTALVVHWSQSQTGREYVPGVGANHRQGECKSDVGACPGGVPERREPGAPRDGGVFEAAPHRRAHCRRALQGAATRNALLAAAACRCCWCANPIGCTPIECANTEFLALQARGG
eukprot:1355717-Pyramimonas_sp.AAC.1